MWGKVQCTGKVHNVIDNPIKVPWRSTVFQIINTGLFLWQHVHLCCFIHTQRENHSARLWRGQINEASRSHVYWYLQLDTKYISQVLSLDLYLVSRVKTTLEHLVLNCAHFNLVSIWIGAFHIPGIPLWAIGRTTVMPEEGYTSEDRAWSHISTHPHSVVIVKDQEYNMILLWKICTYHEMKYSAEL